MHLVNTVAIDLVLILLGVGGKNYLFPLGLSPGDFLCLIDKLIEIYYYMSRDYCIFTL